MLAKIYPLRESKKELPEKGRVFSTKLFGSPGFVSPSTLSLKTWQISLVDPNGLDMSSEELPKSGTMRNGILYERQTLVHRTKERGSGLWPTPQKFDATCGDLKGKEYTGKNRHAMKLIQAVKNPKMWPTPSVCGNHNKKGASKTSGDGLSTAVKMFPTSTNSMVTTGDLEQARYSSKNRPEYKEVNSGKLNPQWVEWLMGFPQGWTDLNV